MVGGSGGVMGASIRSGFAVVSGAGRVSYSIQVTKMAGGGLPIEMLERVRLLDEDREIGREDPRFQLVANHLGVA